MPVKKKYILLAAFFLLAALALVWLLQQDHSAYRKREAEFRIHKPENITRMTFSRGEESLVFEKEDGRWQHAGGEELRQEALELFLRCLSDIEVKSPVNESYLESCCSDTRPVEVSLYQKVRKVQSFQVYPTRENIYGNVLRKKADRKPFITWVPWYTEKDLSDLLCMEPSFWRPDLLFDLHPADIREVKIHRPGKTGFTLQVMEDGDFSFKAEGGETAAVDTAAVMRYLTWFRYVPVQNWGLEQQQEEGLFYQSDSLLARLEVYTQNDSLSVSFYPLFRDRENGAVKDMDRLAVEVRKKGYSGPACLNYFDVDPILQEAGYFLKH